MKSNTQVDSNIKDSIDDSFLIKRIETSFFETAQKTELIKRLPKMTTNEKEQLLVIIEKAEKKMMADETYQKNLSALNKETEAVMHTAVREETSNARKAFESYDDKMKVAQLKELEDELRLIPD